MRGHLARAKETRPDGLAVVLWFPGVVFTPTLLTILGVIMYLREGWVIGHAGVVGGLTFFPAATGIMAGANMSGELKDPRRNIPLGTMSAIGVSLVIYLLLAYWLARSATAEELQSNYTIMVDLAAWGPAVVAGLLGATFSSGLASLVGAPRILQALGEQWSSSSSRGWGW